MADAAILIGWDRVVPGREQTALALFGSSMELYGALQSEGAIESFEPVILSPAGGDLNGFILLRGSADQIDAVKRDERFIDLTMRAQYLCEGFGMKEGFLGEALQARMAKWSQIIAE